VLSNKKPDDNFISERHAFVLFPQLFRNPHLPTIFKNSSSEITATPNSRALSNFDPAPGPATT
jgi:hypothetical protein